MLTLKPVAAALAGALVLASTLHAGTADARERSRTWQNSHGGSGIYQRNTVREHGSMSRDTSWQNANGRSGSSSLDRARDHEAGTWLSERNVKRGNGDTASWSKSGQKTDTGAVVHGEGRNFRGQDVSMDRTITQNDDGSRSVETTRVNETTGKSLTTDKTVARTEDGYSSTGSYATGSGKTGTTAGSLMRTDTGYTRSNSATNSEGQTANRTVDMSRDDGSVSRTVTGTGFDGETRMRSTTLSPLP